MLVMARFLTIPLYHRKEKQCHNSSSIVWLVPPSSNFHECYVHPESKILKTNTWNLEIAIAWDGNLTGHVLTCLWSGPLYIVIYTQYTSYLHCTTI
jgi:hypothetical protein